MGASKPGWPTAPCGGAAAPGFEQGNQNSASWRSLGSAMP